MERESEKKKKKMMMMMMMMHRISNEVQKPERQTEIQRETERQRDRETERQRTNLGYARARHGSSVERQRSAPCR